MPDIDGIVERIFAPAAEIIGAIVFFELPIFGGIPIIVLWLMAAAIFLTVWLRFQPLTGLGHSITVVRGKFSAKTDPGVISSFQSVATELSSTVGLGNIAGVAIAISLGGPGAAFWIALFGFFGMSVKMAEATLGVMYRRVNDDGSVVGGPMYYLRDGLAQIGFARLGAVLGTAYAAFAVLGLFGADLFQSNQVTAIIVDTLGQEFLHSNRWIVGTIVAAFIAAVIIGGVTSVARWTARITPLMALLYMVCVLIVVIVNLEAVPAAVSAMITGAFTGEGVAGGVIGVAIIGIKRSLFSNGAGVGTAGMGHAAAKTREPATEGYTAMWEPVIDSVVVCVLTALAIVVTGSHSSGAETNDQGVAVTAAAFGTVAEWFPVMLTIIVALFGFSTVIAYVYYGELAMVYLLGDKRWVRYGFRITWIIGSVVGSAATLESVIAFADASFFLMAIPNLLGIYFLAKVLRLEILRHRLRATTGTLPVIPEDLQVGMGDHEPTPEQVDAAA